MQSAIIVANQVVVMFLLMGLGMFAKKKGLLTLDSTKVFANLLLIIVMPVMIIKSYYRPYQPELLKGLLFSMLFTVVFHVVAILFVELVIRPREDSEFRIEKMAAVYSNCSFMAIPLLMAAIGEDGVFYGIAFAGIFNIFSWTHGVSTLTGQKVMNPRNVLTNPGFVAFAIGLVLYFTQLPLPKVVVETLGHVAGLNTPLAMIITGVFLADINLKETLTDWRIYRASFIRIIILPFIMVVIMKLLRINTWFDGADKVILANILSCACPTAVSAILLVSKFNLNGEHGAKIVAVSTLFAVVTMPLFVVLVTGIF